MDGPFFDVQTPGRKWRVPVFRLPVTIGRHLANVIPIDDPAAARFHCVIELTPGGLVVRDLGSPSGTMVNGVRIETAPLNGGDALQVGHCVVRFVPPPAPGARSVPAPRFGTDEGAANQPANLAAQSGGAALTASTRADAPSRAPSPFAGASPGGSFPKAGSPAHPRGAAPPSWSPPPGRTDAPEPTWSESESALAPVFDDPTPDEDEEIIDLAPADESQPVDLEAADTPAMDMEAIDLESVDSDPVDLEPTDLTLDLTPLDLKPRDIDDPMEHG
jgi:hypothetical protein